MPCTWHCYKFQRINKKTCLEKTRGKDIRSVPPTFYQLSFFLSAPKTHFFYYKLLLIRPIWLRLNGWQQNENYIWRGRDRDDVVLHEYNPANGVVFPGLPLLFCPRKVKHSQKWNINTVPTCVYERGQREITKGILIVLINIMEGGAVIERAVGSGYHQMDGWDWLPSITNTTN